MDAPARNLPGSPTPDEPAARYLLGASIHRELSGKRITYAEFAHLPEQAGLQLIDGLLVREPAPDDIHQGLVVSLSARLYFYVEPRRLGQVLVAPFDVVLADDQVLQPDILFVSSGRLHLIQMGHLTAAPDLAVEILSPSTRRYDLGRKRELYVQHGCAELWIIDPGEQTIAQHLQGGAGWIMKRFGRHDTVYCKAIPGFAIRAAELSAQPTNRD